MPAPSDRERLQHIQEAITLIIEYTGQMDLDSFRQDYKTQLSVERLLEILGEAATHLSVELKARYPDIPWRQITDLRNIVSHEYFRVRLELIWDVATRDIPVLAEQIQGIVRELDE